MDTSIDTESVLTSLDKLIIKEVQVRKCLFDFNVTRKKLRKTEIDQYYQEICDIANEDKNKIKNYCGM